MKDDKKKILIATEDIISSSLVDIFIDVELDRNYCEFWPDKYDNDFDLSEQFRKERNDSRNFRIYGLIDSTIINGDGLQINVFIDENLTQQVFSTTSTPVVYLEENVFGKRKGKFLIELENYPADFVWIFIQGNGVNYDNQIYKQQLVFKDNSGEFIEYGTETVEVGDDGIPVVIENDFPFFYNKHWIKKDLLIEEVKNREIEFEQSSYEVDENDSITITIKMNQPSVFGNESVDVVLLSVPNEAIGLADPQTDTTNSFPITFTWNPGEQDKTITINAIQDNLIEFPQEIFDIKLVNNQNINLVIDGNESTKIIINDTTDRKLVNYNFQKVIRTISPYPQPVAPYPAVLFNGFPNTHDNEISTATTSNQNFYFYPNDTWELTIINRGVNTILPIIPDVLIQGQTMGVEEFWSAGTSKSFQITTKYIDHDNLPLEAVKLKFRESQILSPAPGEKNNITINGFTSSGDITLDASSFFDYTNNPANWTSFGIDYFFTPSEVNTTNNKDVILQSVHPANNINVTVPEPQIGATSLSPLGGLDGAPLYLGGRVTTITDQIPFKVTLNSNFNNNTQSRYEFIINKPGYQVLNIAPQSIIAGIVPSEAYLVTSLQNIIGPDFSFSGNPCNTLNSVLTAGTISEYFVNGLPFITQDFSTGNNPHGSTPTLYGHSSLFTAEFRPNPLTVNVSTCSGLIGVSNILS